MLCSGRSQHLEIVSFLLARGAEPNLPEEGIAPRGHALPAAVCRGHLDIGRLLLEHGADPKVEIESSADTLTMALERDPQLVELLCSHGAARNVHLLAHDGDVHTAAAVFAANPALADDPESSANAAGQGRGPFVRLMLRHHPLLGQRVSGDAKARELTEFLFAHGANPNHRDWLHLTPLHEFARLGAMEKAGLFLDHGADRPARDEDICSAPLGWAAKFGQTAMARFLLQRGARPNLSDDPPWATPLAWAVRRGNAEIADLLRQHGVRSP